MGVIQNSLNQAIATVVGAGLASKHLSQQAAQVKTSELNELSKLSEEVPKLKNVDAPEAEEQVKFDTKAKELAEKDILDQAVTKGTVSSSKIKNVVLIQKGLEMSQGTMDAKNLELALKESRLEELKKKYADEYELATKPKQKGWGGNK